MHLIPIPKEYTGDKSRLRAVVPINVTMKPHLPACLFRALLAPCVAAMTFAAPVFADVPGGYEPVTITDVNQLTSYKKSDYIAFIISSDITDNTTQMKGEHQYWGDEVLHTHRLTFAGIESDYPSSGALYISSELVAERFQELFFSQNATTSFDGGGAIQGAPYSSITLSDNKNVTFFGNSADGGEGGAIYAFHCSTVDLRNNENVTFCENSAHCGGALLSQSEISFTKNNTVTFSGNSAETIGGAICASGYSYSPSDISFTKNSTVTFCGNLAETGGAITVMRGEIMFTENDVVTFSGNSSTAYNSGGGAIYVSQQSSVCFAANNVVTFSGNSAETSGPDTETGGAFYVYFGVVSFMGNGTVAFSGNSATAYGGAFYVSGNKSEIKIEGNDSVTFRGNYETVGRDDTTTYQLRSMYLNSGALKLAAGEEQNITFYDTLYASSASTVSFNAKYEDKDGVEQTAKGDIVFSGKYAEDDLRKLKPNYTQQELTDSLTTEVETTTNLYGGRLCIEDGAIYKGNGVIVAADSGATLRLADGTLNQAGYDVTLNADTKLDLLGANSITATTLDMMDGSAMTFTLGETNLTTAALTLTGMFNQGGTLAINLANDGTVEAYAKYALMTMTSGTTPETWDASRIAVSGLAAGVSDLCWESGTLYLTVPQQPLPIIWTGHESSVWDTTSLNWESNGSASTYKDGIEVEFGDAGAGTVMLAGVFAPENMLVENSGSHDYTFAGDGSITGATTLTKRGDGKLTIDTANTYTGGTVVEGGTLVVGNSAALGTGNLAMSAGVLDLGGNTIANNVSTQGEVCIANGRIAGKVSMSDTILQINGDVTISGKITAGSENLIAVDVGATLSISQTIANTGIYLEIAGAVDVSGISGTKVDTPSYIGGIVQGNGFEQSNMRIQVISNAKTSRCDISEASFIYKGAEVELDSSCAFNIGETDYTVFYVNSETESLGTALDGAEAAQVELAGVVMKHGTELTVDRNASTDLIQVTSGKATMNIAEGVTLSETDATRTDFILQGAGEYRLTSGSTTLGVTLGNNWEGTVELVDVAVFEDFDLNKYGKAGSVVRMDGATVKLAPSNNVPFLPTLELTGEGMTITGCYAGETYIFAGGVIGDGDFVYNPTSLQHKQTYIFTGDVSQWTGAYESTGSKTSTLKFYGDAMEMGAAIKATAGTVNVEVGNGTDAFVTTFGNDITASSLKVLDKATASLTKGTTIAGEIEVAGSLKIQGEGQLNVGDSVSMGAVDEGTPATLAGVDISSAELSARGVDKPELSGVSITTMEDFKLENVRLDGSFIDIGEDTTFYIKNVEISADTRITDGAARMFIEGGKAFLDESNTEASAPTMSLADVTFYRSGDTETWVTLHENVSLVSLTSEVFTKVMLTGTDLWLDLTGLSAQVGDATAFSVSFEDGALYDVDSLRVYATLNGEKYLDGYTTQQGGTTTTLYFSQQIPEPTTSTLSLLAFAALAARRRRSR